MSQLQINDIRQVLVLGAGTMGWRIALSCALNGYQCTLYDISEEALESARKYQHDFTKRSVQNGQINHQERQTALQAIVYTTDPQQAAEKADLVSESVIEDVSVKNQVWEQFGKLCPPHTLFTTNTSYLLPSMFAEISGRPARFCALHFHDVFHARVVDIMPHAGTEDWVIPLLESFGKSLQQIPVIVQKESSGYIFNQMLMSLIGTAGALLTSGTGTIEDIDRSWMGNFNLPIGPFGILDEVGLDTAWHIVSVRKDRRSQQFAELLHGYVQQGKLGQKSGAGFYQYPNPRYRDEDFLL